MVIPFDTRSVNLFDTRGVINLFNVSDNEHLQCQHILEQLSCKLGWGWGDQILQGIIKLHHLIGVPQPWLRNYSRVFMRNLRNWGSTKGRVTGVRQNTDVIFYLFRRRTRELMLDRGVFVTISVKIQIPPLPDRPKRWSQEVNFFFCKPIIRTTSLRFYNILPGLTFFGKSVFRCIIYVAYVERLEMLFWSQEYAVLSTQHYIFTQSES